MLDTDNYPAYGVIAILQKSDMTKLCDTSHVNDKKNEQCRSGWNKKQKNFWFKRKNR